jgi:hypothetical protein
MIYFGSRTLVHSSFSHLFKAFTIGILTLGVYDLMDIWTKSRRAKITQIYKEDGQAPSKVKLNLKFIKFNHQ